MKKEFIKCTGPGGTSIHQFAQFILPTVDGPGSWMEPCDNRQPLKPHFWGYHLADPDYISDWFGIENYWAEHDDDVVPGHGCLVARRIRLLEPIPSTDEQWTSIAVAFVEPVVGLVRDMHLPHQYTNVIEPAYDKIKAWIKGDDSMRIDASGLAMMATSLAGRNQMDSYASYEWMANSKAAANAAASVALLAHLERPDGQRLADSLPARAVRRALLKSLQPLIHDMGKDVVGIPENNFRVAKNICGLAAQAAESSVRQMTWRGDNDISHRQRDWIAAARVERDKPLEYQALSGIRAHQSQIIRQTLGF